MADTYRTPQTITTVPAGELGTTTISNPQQSVNFGVGIFEMPQTISTNYSITTGTRAFSVGPLQINAVVRVPDGSSWVIR